MLGRAGVIGAADRPASNYPPNCAARSSAATSSTSCATAGLPRTLRATTLDGEVWEARFGYVVAKKPSDQHASCSTRWSHRGAQIRPVWKHIHQVSTISNSDERQQVTLSNGEQISARLVVLANGLNIGLPPCSHRAQVISSCHSDYARLRRRACRLATFDFPALTYWPSAELAMAYMTTFRSRQPCASICGLPRHDRPWLSIPQSGPRPHARADAGD